MTNMPKRTQVTVKAWLNPLSFLGEHIINRDSVTHEEVSQFLCLPSAEIDSKGFVIRFNELAKVETVLIAAPGSEEILQHLVWPLKYAKGTYCYGNYIGTIALCGMVAEMLAILLFDLSKDEIKGCLENQEAQKEMSISEFEEKGQKKRVNILFGYGLIDTDRKDKFDLIREKRRGYLHYYSHNHDDIRDDSRKVYSAITALVGKIIGQDVRNGRLVFRSSNLRKYLIKKGVIQDATKNRENSNP